MINRKEIAKVVHGINLFLIVVEELLAIDIDCVTFLLYLKMFKEFIQKQNDASGKT